MQLMAHRGGAGLRVENTLAAFAHAIELGAAGAELDVHLSRHGEVVVHHDEALNPAYCRHRGGRWIDPAEAVPLSTLSHKQMLAYDIGTPCPDSAYARIFDRIRPVPEQHIPLLGEVIALVKQRSSQFRLVIEIKTPPLAAARKPWRSLVDATLAVIAEHQFFARTTLCSFDWGALRHATKCRPDLATWYTSMPASWLCSNRLSRQDIPPDGAQLRALQDAAAGGNAPWYGGFDPHRFGASHAAAIAAAGGRAWFPHYRDFNADSARELAAAGLIGAVWSVNLREPEEMARLARAGADFLVTDYPDMPIPA